MNIEKQLSRLKEELESTGCSQKTIKTYQFYVKKFLEYANKPLKYIYFRDMERYKKTLLKKELSVATINLAISSLRYFYQNILKRKTADKISRLKREKKLPNILPRETIKKLIEHADTRKQKILIQLLYSSGLRVSECVSIKIEDMNLSKKVGKIRKGKGKKDRFFITSQAASKEINKYLRERKRESQYLFETKRGHWSVKTAQLILKKAASKAQVTQRVHPHALRASFATHLLENGTPLPTVQKLLGHTNIETTMFYIKTSYAFMDKIKSPLDELYETKKNYF